MIVLHGGFWRSAYDCSLGRPLASYLLSRGWATANVEYRRVGNGGGLPTTLRDVERPVDIALEERPDSPVVVLGHSAGGHLAACVARTRSEVTHVVSQAGVLDLNACAADGLGAGAAVAFMAGAGTEGWVEADPARHVPLRQPVHCLHARDDVNVPFSQSAAYVEAALTARGQARLYEVTGANFGLIDVDSSAWAEVVRLIGTFVA